MRVLYAVVIWLLLAGLAQSQGPVIEKRYTIYDRSLGVDGGMHRSSDASGNIYHATATGVIVDTSLADRGGYTAVLPATALKPSLGYTVTLRLMIADEFHTDDARGNPSLLVNAYEPFSGMRSLYLSFQRLDSMVLKIFAYHIDPQTGKIAPDHSRAVNVTIGSSKTTTFKIIVKRRCVAEGTFIYCWDFELFDDFSGIAIMRGDLVDYAQHGGQIFGWSGMVWIGDDSQRAGGVFELSGLGIVARERLVCCLYLPIATK